MNNLERLANGWTATEIEAFNLVRADPTMPDYKDPNYDDWLFHKAWSAAHLPETDTKSRAKIDDC